MTDPRVIEALDLLRQAMGGFPVTQDGYDQWTRARDTIDALRAEQDAPVPASSIPPTCAADAASDHVPNHVRPLPAMPEGVRPLVFDGRFAASRSADGATEVVSRDGRDAYVQDHTATVCVRTTSRAESEATARVMHAAAEWHARGYDLVPVRRNDHA